jgi:hypothetical protein
MSQKRGDIGKCFNKIAITIVYKSFSESSNKFRDEIETCCGIIAQLQSTQNPIYFSVIGDFPLSEKIIKCFLCRRVCLLPGFFHSNSPLFQQKHAKIVNKYFAGDLAIVPTRSITKLISS